MGVGVETVRYYQRIGLLDVPDRSAGVRQYGSSDLEQLRFVVRAKALGFTLEEIATLVRLSASQCTDVEHIARTRLKTVSAKISDLQRMAAVLREVVAGCETREPYRGCPIIETLLSH